MLNGLNGCGPDIERLKTVHGESDPEGPKKRRLFPGRTMASNRRIYFIGLHCYRDEFTY